MYDKGANSLAQKLGTLEELPDSDGAWKEPAWERLYIRICRPSGDSRSPWGSLAAACLLIGAIASLVVGRAPNPTAPATTAAAAPTEVLTPVEALGPVNTVAPVVASVNRRPAAHHAVAVTKTPALMKAAAMADDIFPSPSADKAAVTRLSVVSPRVRLPVAYLNEVGIHTNDTAEQLNNRKSWFRLPLHLLYPGIPGFEPSDNTANNSTPISIPINQ